jgi:hypothetical protein
LNEEVGSSQNIQSEGRSIADALDDLREKVYEGIKIVNPILGQVLDLLVEKDQQEGMYPTTSGKIWDKSLKIISSLPAKNDPRKNRLRLAQRRQKPPILNIGPVLAFLV